MNSYYKLDNYREIGSETVIQFLSDRGWKQTKIMPGICSIWEIEKGGEVYQALIPLNFGFVDYPNRMIDALKAIGEAEGIPFADPLDNVLREIGLG